MMKRRSWFLAPLFSLGLLAALPTAESRQVYVNNETGDDAADGLAEKAEGGGKGPVKTLAKAVSLLSAGDTLNFAATSSPYRETLVLNDVSGSPERPIVIDGHGATITGSDPIGEGWEPAGEPGLYKNPDLLSRLDEANDDTKLQRMFFIIGGVQQRMGRTSKGAHPAFKQPSGLAPGEWTYDPATHAFYVKVEGDLAESGVEAPMRRNGVSIRGRKGVEYLVIQNLICVHALNDGFNLHGTNVREVSFKNIAAYENGDDGYSPHETVESSIDGFWSSGNSTGIGIGRAAVTRIRNARLEGNFADEFLTGVGGDAARDDVANCLFIASAGAQPFVLGKNQEGAQSSLDNVLISSPRRKRIEIGAKGTVNGRRLSVYGADWLVEGTANISDSVLVGKTVTCLNEGRWNGSHNVYDIKLNELAAGGDKDSEFKEAPELPEYLSRLSSPPFPTAGADPSQFQIPPRPIPNPKAGKFTTLPAVEK